MASSFIALCWACPIVPLSFRSLTPLLQLLGFPFSFVCLVNAILPRGHQLDHEATSTGVETADQIWAQVGCCDFRRECELRSTHISQSLAASSWHEPGAKGLEHWLSPSRVKNLASCQTVACAFEGMVFVVTLVFSSSAALN